MRALVLGDFNRMTMAEFPDPVPGPGEALIQVVATGICGSDIHGYTGENRRRVPGQVMGHESVGYTAALGAGVARGDLKAGLPVTFTPVIVPEGEIEQERYGEYLETETAFLRITHEVGQ